MPQDQKQQIGRYEILEEIGRGAMGVVFKGRDPLIGRAVAVKTITSGVPQSADLLERFYREARAAGGLQHPNIVTIYELAESGGAPFIAMEYLEGESLEKIIARTPALPLATKLGYIVQTCRALDYAHRRGVIHRDVKPANIVVTRDGIVKVVDFGIARLGPTSHTQTGMLLGTLAYMSPEQIRGQHFDERSDVWAMGVVLYELITYQRPFTGENHAALLLSILQNEPSPIWRVFPECPVALEKIISKCLRKDEKERYLSMESLLKDLENLSFSLTGKGSKSVAAAPAAKISMQPAPTVVLPSNPISPAVHPASAAPIALPGARPHVNTILKQSAEGKSHLWRNAALTFALLTVIVLGAIGIAHRDTALGILLRNEGLANVAHLAWAKISNLASRGQATNPVPLATPNTPTLTSAASGKEQTSPNADVGTNAGASEPILEPASSSLPFVEHQQRYLIDLARQAAGRQDYKGAQEQLDEAAKLNGPLNDLVADLRREFSAQARKTELERAAEEEQTLWDKAMAYLEAGDLDDAEESLRDILTLPEGGRRFSAAAHYIDQVIPERRQEEQLWAAAQLQSRSQDPGHFLSAIKALDEVLAAGGTHEQGARQKRDAIIAEIMRGAGGINGTPTPVVSNSDLWQMTRLKNHLDDLVLKGNMAALQEIQDVQSKFEALAEAQGPLAFDARDYLNNVIPKAQKHIEDRLALAESNLSPNGAFMDAVKEYNSAAATQNAVMLRDKVLPMFRQIAQSGGVRAKEAQRYADVLIPTALQKFRQQE
jgi:serine/threonine protein kinase